MKKQQMNQMRYVLKKDLSNIKKFLTSNINKQKYNLKSYYTIKTLSNNREQILLTSYLTEKDK